MRPDASTGDSKQLRVISINPDLTGSDSPVLRLLYQIESVLSQAATRSGADYFVLGGIRAKPPSDFPATVVPSLPEYTAASLNGAEWVDLWRRPKSRALSHGVLSALQSLPPARPNAKTVFFIYHGHPLHIPAAIRLGLALRGRCPITINLYWLHFVYGLHRPGRVPWLRTLLSATARLRRLANVHLAVDSRRLAEFLKRDTGVDAPVLPFFSPMGDDVGLCSRERNGEEPFRLVYPTAVPGRDKGFDLVIKLAEKLGRSDVEIIARSHDGPSGEVCLPTRAAYRGGLRVIPSFLPSAKYQDLLEQADIVLAPYSGWQFLSRTSGVVADAIRMGKPLIGTAGTWIGDQIEAARAGRTFRDGDAGDFVAAVNAALANLDRHRSALISRREHWLSENNARAFVASLVPPPIRDTGPLSAFRQIACQVTLGALLNTAMPLLERGGVPLRLAISRAKQIARGSFGRLKLITEHTLQDARGWENLPGIAWTTSGVKHVEVRLDAHDGYLLASGGSSGAIWQAAWIRNGRHVYLQDVSDGKPLHPRHTLARIRFHRANGDTGVKLPAAALADLWSKRPDDAPVRENALPPICLEPGEWAVIPPPSSGELYLLASHARAFLEKYGGKRLLICTSKAHLDILQLFPHVPVGGIDCAGLDLQSFEMRRQIGRVIKLYYGTAVFPAGAGADVTLGRCSPGRRGFAKIFLEEADLEVGVDADTPRVSDTVWKAARQRMAELGLVEGRTVLISPRAKSTPPPPLPVWQKVSDELIRRGFCVATNCGPGENALSGTSAWNGTLSELYAAVEIGGYFLSARSGLCDLCCTANTALHIVEQDWICALFPGITMLPRLAENGLPDRAFYHTMALDESVDGFAARILRHDDFQAPAAVRQNYKELRSQTG